MTDRYAVMGNPIGHSKSPQIHAAFARQTGQDITYEALLVELDGFAAAVQDFHATGGKGLNITVPFKQDAFDLAQQLTPRAQRAGAVNTLYWNAQDELCGDTTDGIGMVRDLTDNHGITLRDKRILVIGAGGAVRGVLEPLLEQQPRAVQIANRTVAKAEQLAGLFAEFGPIQACGFDAISGEYDVIINGTAAGLSGEVPPIPPTSISASTLCYDMMYGSQPTAFVRWCQQQGAAQALDGLGMLVEQAAESFFIWRGIRPDTRPVIQQLRQAVD